jgi:hypothetical protein
MKADKQKDAEDRRRKVIALVTGDEELMSRYRAARAAYERGEPLIPGEQVLREARERRERA